MRGLLFDGRAENAERAKVAMRVLRRDGVGDGIFCAWWAKESGRKTASVGLKI